MIETFDTVITYRTMRSTRWSEYFTRMAVFQLKGRTTINDFVDFLLLAITFILYNLEISAIAQNDRRHRFSIKIIDEQISGHTFGQNLEFSISLEFLTFFEKTEI